MAVVLYSYFRSSASYRVRIALNLKQISYQTKQIHLLNNGGEQHRPEYRRINPQGLVPSLIIDNTLLTQSSATIEYLEERYPTPSLLPKDPVDRARVRSLAQLIACDIHPLNNLRVLTYLASKTNEDAQPDWYQHWIYEGFNAFEQLLRDTDCNGEFCFGESVGLADLFLIPQVVNAKRYQCELTNYPLITQIYDNCMQLEAFKQNSGGCLVRETT